MNPNSQLVELLEIVFPVEFSREDFFKKCVESDSQKWLFLSNFRVHKILHFVCQRVKSSSYHPSFRNVIDYQF